MSDSDSDEYINVESIMESLKQNIYQIQLDKEEVFIKKIGVGDSAPDVIIKEDFGLNNELSLYNCVYLENELNTIGNNTYFYPIIKLIDNIKNDKVITSSIAIKFKENLSIDTKINNFDLYFVKNIVSDDFIKVLGLEKDVFSENIIEKIIYYNSL
jgi:hypothetical protein